MSKQLLRSGTSIGANIFEAQCSISKKEFLSKIQISFKECAEAAYWLSLLFETGFINETEFNSIYSECDEIRKLLSSITTTAKKNIISNS